MIDFVIENIDQINKDLKTLVDGQEDVLKKAINDTAKQARRTLQKAAGDTYAIKVGGFNKDMPIKPAKANHLVAIIHSKGEDIPLKSFAVIKNTRTAAAKAKVYKKNSYKSLTLRGGEKNGKDLKAFVTTMKNGEGKKGHTGLFQRIPGKKTKTGKPALKQFYSVSIPGMLGNEDNMKKKVEPDLYKNLRANLDKHMAYVWGRGRA